MWNNKIKELVSKHERINNLYNIGPIQKAEIEDFVDSIVKECLNNMENDDGDLDFAIWKTKQDFGIE